MDKFHSTILGFAVGDALGVPYEFKSRFVLKKTEINMIGYGTHNQPKGTYSDDTAMVLATLDTMNKGYDLKKLFGNFRLWYYKGEYAIEGNIFDIGNTTKKFLMLPFDSKKELNNRYSGNGSLMRVLPYAFYLLKEDDSKKRFKIISQSSRLTHPSILAEWGAFLYEEYFRLLLQGLNKLSAYEKLCDLYIEKAPSVFSGILSKKVHLKYESSIKSSGYVVDTLASVFWTFLRNEGYKNNVVASIKLGDDTDTIGALVGALAGFYYSDIPQDWLDDLRGKILIEHIIDDFEVNFAK